MSQRMRKKPRAAKVPAQGALVFVPEKIELELVGVFEPGEGAASAAGFGPDDDQEKDGPTYFQSLDEVVDFLAEHGSFEWAN